MEAPRRAEIERPDIVLVDVRNDRRPDRDQHWHYHGANQAMGGRAFLTAQAGSRPPRLWLVPVYPILLALIGDEAHPTWRP
jgi:hypothetical protein